MPKPRGLKKSTKKEPHPEEETTGQIVIEECGSEMDELQAIYTMGCTELTTENLDQAATFFRATIHECDRMQRSAQDSSTPDSYEPFPPIFYEIYGFALFHLSQISQNEKELNQSEEFMETALEMMQKCIEMEDTWDRRAGIIQIRLAQCVLDVINENYEGADNQTGQIKGALSAAKEMPDFSLGSLVPLVSQLRNIGEQMGNVAVVDEAISVFDSVGVDSSSDIEVVKEYGSCYMVRSSILQEVDEEGENVEEVARALNVAIVQFEKAIAMTEDEDEQLDLCVFMCECHLQLGVFEKNEEKALKHHQKAVDLFEKVESVRPDLLPEDFAEMIEELRSEITGQ